MQHHIGLKFKSSQTNISRKFKGISSHPAFKAAVHQSLAATTQNATAILHTADTYYYGKHHLTAFLILMFIYHISKC